MDASSKLTASTTASGSFPATKTAHWVSGPVFVCDTHAIQIEAVGNAIGMQVAITHAVPEGAQCDNCKNEASKRR